MQLYFIRHAQSINNALWDSTGTNKGRSEDPGITETGFRQAERLAEFLAGGSPALPAVNGDLQNRAGFHLTHLYTSLMLRAVTTTSILARRLELVPMAWKDLHESGGIYLEDEMTGEPLGLPGKPRSYFEQLFPELQLPPDLGEEGWWNRPWESPEERTARANRFLLELLNRHGNTEDRVGVVSHGAFYNRLLGEILHLPSRAGLWFMMNNCAVSRIDFNENEVSLIYTNRADFLLDDLVT